jgi:RNA polymerase subunit RPABC4/transcription elongation factor Spt4
MRLFARKKSPDPPLERCPRCSELVAEDASHACPYCGWDLREAYQGSRTVSRVETSQAGAPPGGTDGETT